MLAGILTMKMVKKQHIYMQKNPDLTSALLFFENTWIIIWPYTTPPVKAFMLFALSSNFSWSTSCGSYDGIDCLIGSSFLTIPPSFDMNNFGFWNFQYTTSLSFPWLIDNGSVKFMKILMCSSFHSLICREYLTYSSLLRMKSS